MQDRRSRRSRRAPLRATAGRRDPIPVTEPPAIPDHSPGCDPPPCPPAGRSPRSRRARRGRPTRRDGGRYGPTRARFPRRSRAARPHPRLPQRNAPIRCRDARQLGRISPCPQSRRGRPRCRSRRLGGRPASPLGYWLVRDRPLRQHLRALGALQGLVRAPTAPSGLRGCGPVPARELSTKSQRSSKHYVVARAWRHRDASRWRWDFCG